MHVATQKLPVAVMIMAHVKYRATALENVFAAEDGNVVSFLKRPLTVKSVRVRRHDA